MRSIAELMSKQNIRKQALLTSGITDFAGPTTQITETIPELWMTELVKFGEGLRVLDQFAIINKDLVGKKGDSVWIPINTAHLTISTSHSEGEVRTLTEMTNIDTVKASIATGNFYRGAIRIGKDLASLSAVDLVAQAKYSIAQDLADDVDLALMTVIQGTGVTKWVYGGASSNNEASDLAAGDVLTTDLIVDAMVKIEDDDFVPKTLIIGTAQHGILRKDSQFVNASEYGGREVILKGEVGEYLALKIITVTNANFAFNGVADTADTTTYPSVGCHSCVMIGESKQGNPVGYALVWKENPAIDYEYLKDEAAHQIYYDQAFVGTLVQPKAISHIKVTDA